MSEERKILIEVTDTSNKHAGWMIFCPGCKYGHMLDDRWTFNGNLEKPTFSPSLLYAADETDRRCHSHVTDGNIQFLDDCAHELKGKTVPLQPFTWDEAVR